MVNLSQAVKIKHGTIELRVWYHSSKNECKVVWIKAQFDGENQPCAFIQFFGEFKRFSQKKWIIDTSPQDKLNPPYYSLSDVWGKQWNDKPLYDLCGIGAIIFNTLFAAVDKRNKSDPKDWDYLILFGFSWGMRSRDCISVDQVPIKLVPSYRMQTFACLLRCYFPNGTFTMSNTSATIKEDNL